MLWIIRQTVPFMILYRPTHLTIGLSIRSGKLEDSQVRWSLRRQLELMYNLCEKFISRDALDKFDQIPIMSKVFDHTADNVYPSFVLISSLTWPINSAAIERATSCQVLCIVSSPKVAWEPGS